MRVIKSNRRVTRNSYDASGAARPIGGCRGGGPVLLSRRRRAEARRVVHPLNSAGALAYEGIAYRYDNVGRLAYQSMAVWTGNSWTNRGDAADIAYNAFGEVATRSLDGSVQERSEYDAAGRMWRSTGGDGVTRYFIHDAPRRQPLSLETDGTTNVQGKTLDEVLAIATGNGARNVGAAATGIVATAST
ncbi:hypothetical protein AB5I41_23615 [Sphingomonas sp. MMS24-JH45]